DVGGELPETQTMAPDRLLGYDAGSGRPIAPTWTIATPETSPMLRRASILGLVLFFGSAVHALAEHAKIVLDVAGPNDKQTSFMDQTPPESGKTPRPVVKAKAGETIRIQWSFTNVYPHKTLENVVVHFFIARQEKVGQKELPDMRGDV